MEDEKRDGMLLLVMQAQFVVSCVLIGLLFVGGSVLLKFAQLPGGLYDAGAPPGSTRTAAVILLHLLQLGALGWLLRSLPTPQARPASIAWLAMSLLVVPFGAVPAIAAYRSTQRGWGGAEASIAGLGTRPRMLAGGLWLIVMALAGLMTFGAYVGFLSGNAGAALLLLALAGLVQWGGLRGLQRLRLRSSRLQSPLPMLPSADKPSS